MNTAPLFAVLNIVEINIVYIKITSSKTERHCRLNKMASFTGFPVNAVKSTSERLEDLCKIESKNMSETSDLPVPRPLPFQNMLTTSATAGFGTKSSLLIVILIGTHAGSKRRLTRVHPNNINRDGGIEIPEAWMHTIKKHNNSRTV